MIALRRNGKAVLYPELIHKARGKRFICFGSGRIWLRADPP